MAVNELKSCHRLTIRRAAVEVSSYMSACFCRRLGWEAATERLLEAAEILPKQHVGHFTRVGQSSLWCLYRWFLGERLHQTFSQTSSFPGHQTTCVEILSEAGPLNACQKVLCTSILPLIPWDSQGFASHHYAGA